VAGRIPQSFVDDLISRADIVEVIGSRVQLKKAGHEFKACCPFHNEKTPSFTVSPAKQFYHCFGCGAHGTALGFLMEHDRLGFVEAVEALAQNLGMEVPHEAGSHAPRIDEGLYTIMGETSRLYCELLRNSEQAVEYLRDRGLSGEIAKQFGVGYVPDAWDTVLGRLGKSEESKRNLLSCGLIIEKDDGGAYDRFRGRIMFPIRDLRGRVIAFGGRVIGDGEPKYLNSPETPLFHKGRELYGLYEARQAMRDLPRLIVVEGYMDVVSLAQHGVCNAVATLGTATTGDHLNRMFRVCDEVVFCFDGDRAGRAAAWRALENALPYVRSGRQIRFSFLPDGEDPDTLIRGRGKDEFNALLDQSETLSEYLIRHLSEDVDMGSLDGRAKFAELGRPLVRRIPAGIYRQMLIDKLAETIGMDGAKLKPMLDEAPETYRKKPLRQVSTGRGNLVRQAITLLLHKPALASLVVDREWLKTAGLKGSDILLELLEDCSEHPDINTAGLLEHWRERDAGPHLMKLAGSELLVEEDLLDSEFQDLLQRLMSQTGPEKRIDLLVAKAAGDDGLNTEEKSELQALLRAKGLPEASESNE
jgi:DNA primase